MNLNKSLFAFLIWCLSSFATAVANDQCDNLNGHWTGSLSFVGDQLGHYVHCYADLKADGKINKEQQCKLTLQYYNCRCNSRRIHCSDLKYNIHGSCLNDQLRMKRYDSRYGWYTGTIADNNIVLHIDDGSWVKLYKE